MEYKEIKRIKGRLKTARKFLKISNTMVRDMKSDISGNDDLVAGIDSESFEKAILSLDVCIDGFSAKVSENGQLDLFSI